MRKKFKDLIHCFIAVIVGVILLIIILYLITLYFQFYRMGNFIKNFPKEDENNYDLIQKSDYFINP